MYDVKPDAIPGKPGTILRVYPLEGKVRTFVVARFSDLLHVDGSSRMYFSGIRQIGLPQGDVILKDIAQIARLPRGPIAIIALTREGS